MKHEVKQRSPIITYKMLIDALNKLTAEEQRIKQTRFYIEAILRELGETSEKCEIRVKRILRDYLRETTA